MKGPKITVIGAGSYFFGRCVIHHMSHSPVFAGGTLALVDTDPKVLSTMVRLAKRICDDAGSGVTVTGSTDRRKVMRDSDFVVLTFSYRNAYYRGLDTQIAAKHGIRLCGADTSGPGGIFRSLREIPHIMGMVADARKLCPSAWVINLVNPTTVMGIALMRYAADMRTFALCDGNHEPYNTLNWCKHVGILPKDATVLPPDVERDLELKIGGVNHVTWMTAFKFRGKDYMPVVRRKLEEAAKASAKKPHWHSKSRYNDQYALQLFDIFGHYPTNTSHTKEYVPFFQGYGIKPVQPEPLALFDATRRQQGMDAWWKETQEFASGKRSIKDFHKSTHNDHATDIIETMWGRLGKAYYINSPNRGAITNLPDDAFLELKCDIDMNGPRPRPFGALPRGILAHQHQVLDTHELTAEAAVTCDRAILRRALMTDPMTLNIGDADACIAELLEAQRDVLPAKWYKRR